MPIKHVKRGVHRIKHHVLPHPHFKTRATLLQSKAVFFYTFTMLLFLLLFKGVPHYAPGILSYASNIYVNDLLKYTNIKRSQAGVNSLTINPKLTEAAKRKAEHMFQHNYWAHVAPDGTDPWSFIIGEDYDYLYAGENLAKNFNSSKDVVEAWYKSPSHKENLVNERYTDVGFAAVNGVLDGYETTLVVQMFGKLRGGPAQVAVKGDDNNTSVRTETEEAIVAKPTVQQIPVSENSPVNIPVFQPTTKINVYNTIRMASVLFAMSMLALFTLDIWYSKRHMILKCTGHSLAHMAFLIFAITVIYFSLQPGRLI